MDVIRAMYIENYIFLLERIYDDFKKLKITVITVGWVWGCELFCPKYRSLEEIKLIKFIKVFVIG